MNLEHTEFRRLNEGAEIFDLKISSKKDKSTNYNILLNDSTLLRVQQKKAPRISKKLAEWINGAKDLTSQKAQQHLKDIISHNNSIKEKISRSTLRGNGSKIGFEEMYLVLESKWKKISELEKKIGTSLLKKDKIGFCEKCFALRQAPGLVGGTPQLCQFCQTPIKYSKTYYSLPESTAQYIAGFWFENYVAKRLEKLGWMTFVGVYIYGNSGVKYEIDILAIKKGRTLIVECKSGGTGLNDLSSHIAKFYEIRTTSAAFVSMQKTNSDVRKVANTTGSFYLIDEIRNDRDLIRKLSKI